MSFWHPFQLGPKKGEAKLVSAAKRGDRNAFDALVRLHEPLLAGFIARRVGAPSVDDVLQETLLAAWAALPRFSEQVSFKSWLFGIAQHKIADALRGRGQVATEGWTEELEDQMVDPKDAYAASDLQQSVRATLASLPDVQRQVLELYYYAELTLPEIAEALGRNLNTVKYQFYRAHAQAADGLQEYGPSAGERLV